MAADAAQPHADLVDPEIRHRPPGEESLVLAHRVDAAAIGNIEAVEKRELMLRIAGPCRLDGVRRREIIDDPGLARSLRRLGFDARADGRETQRPKRDIALIFDAPAPAEIAEAAVLRCEGLHVETGFRHPGVAIAAIGVERQPVAQSLVEHLGAEPHIALHEGRVLMIEAIENAPRT